MWGRIAGVFLTTFFCCRKIHLRVLISDLLCTTSLLASDGGIRALHCTSRDQQPGHTTAPSSLWSHNNSHSTSPQITKQQLLAFSPGHETTTVPPPSPAWSHSGSWSPHPCRPWSCNSSRHHHHLHAQQCPHLASPVPHTIKAIFITRPPLGPQPIPTRFHFFTSTRVSLSMICLWNKPCISPLSLCQLPSPNQTSFNIPSSLFQCPGITGLER